MDNNITMDILSALQKECVRIVELLQETGVDHLTAYRFSVTLVEHMVDNFLQTNTDCTALSDLEKLELKRQIINYVQRGLL